MAEIKITTSQIRDLAGQMSSSAQLAENLSNNISRAFFLISNNASNSSIGNIAQKMCSFERKIWNLQERISAGKGYLNAVADKFDETDREIILGIEDEKLATMTDEEFSALVSVQYERDKWEGYAGTTLADTESEYYKNYTDYNAWPGGAYHNYKEKGECTWYAYGRFGELTHIVLPYVGGHMNAKFWLENCQNDERLNVVYGNSAEQLSDLRTPIIAVVTSSTGTGHVAIIENIVYDENGNIAMISVSEANNSGYEPYAVHNYYPGGPTGKSGQNLEEWLANQSGFISAK